MTFLVLVALSLVTYRITRFILLDSLFDTTRDRMVLWLQGKRDTATVDWRTTLWHKILDGGTCAFCVSVWIAGFATAYWSLLLHDEWVGWWFPVWTLAVAAGAMVVYRWVDPPE